MCRRVIRGILFIGFCIQAGLGLAWMCRNITGAQDFAEVTTGVYAAAAHLPKESRPFLYGLQLLAALYGGWRLVRRVCGGGRLFALWGSLTLLTLPMAMQCHLALLPCSLVCSAGLLQLSFCCELFQTGEPVRHVVFWQPTELSEQSGTFRLGIFVGVSACFAAQSALLPEYLFLGAVPPLLTLWLTRRNIRREKKTLKAILILAVAASVGMGACALGRQNPETDRGNDVSGLEWTLVKRVCWPTLWVDSDAMPDRLKEATAGVLWESTYYPGNMERLFRPAVEAAMDIGEAKPLFREMITDAWKAHSPMILRQIGWDVLGYCVTPVILQRQLVGDAYESHSGRNYEIMRNDAPLLTKYYVDYSCWWFASAVILTAVLTIARLAAGERLRGRKEGQLSAVVFFSAMLSVLWYVVQGAGIMDYKYTILINQMWFVWSLMMIRERSQDEREGRRV